MSKDATPEIRLTDSDRDKVVAQLSAAMSEGRLDIGEFEERSRHAYLAKVPSELDGVLEGLPVTPLTPAVRPTPPTVSRGNRWFFSLIGDRTQRGDMDLGDKATSISVLGDTTFDLTQVSIEDVNLRIFSVLGDVTILVRRGTSVAANIFLLLGDRKEDAAPQVRDTTMRVRLRVFTLIGDVKIQVIDSP